MCFKVCFYILLINFFRVIWKFKIVDDKEISFMEIIWYWNLVFVK